MSSSTSTGSLLVTFWVDHLILEVQPVRIPGATEDELGPDTHSSGGIVCFPASLLETVAPAMNCVTSWVGNRVQQLRSDSATNVSNRSTRWNRHMFWAMTQPPSECIPSFICACPCTKRNPCPMKLPRQIKRHSTWTHRSTVPWDFYHNFTLLRQHRFCGKSGKVSLDAVFSRLMTCALMCMLIWRTRIDILCVRA